MKIEVNNQAQTWFKEEMNASTGDFIRFYVRYGGSSPIQTGFSLGATKEEPIEPAVTATYEGIHFFIEERDVWYFDEHDLKVEFDDKLHEPAYRYIKKGL